MPDICMCNGGKCPNKEHCYRFTATPSEYRQVYFSNPPYEEGEPCRYFTPNKLATLLTHRP